MLMLIDTADPRYGGAPDPDEERRRRWEPMSLRIVLPVAGSLGCLIVSGLTAPVVGVVLIVVALALCAYAVRAAWSTPDGRRTEGGGFKRPGVDSESGGEPGG